MVDQYSALLRRWHQFAEYYPRKLRRLHAKVYTHPELGDFFRVYLGCNHLVTVPAVYFLLPNGRSRAMVRCSKCMKLAMACDFCGKQHPKAESCQAPCVEVHSTR